jgi:hypothetical protein
LSTESIERSSRLAGVGPLPRRPRLLQGALLLLLGYAAGVGLLVRDYLVQSRSAEASLAVGRPSLDASQELAAEP